MDLVLGLRSAHMLLGLLLSKYCDKDVDRDSWCHVTCNKSFMFMLRGGCNTVVIIGLAFSRGN